MRIQKLLGMTAMMAVAGILAAPAARAVPVVWTIDSAASSITFGASALGGLLNGSGGTNATGTQNGDLVPGSSLSASPGGVIGLDDFAVTGGIAATATNLSATLSGGPAAIVGNEVDLLGFTLALLSGSVNVTSPLPTALDVTGTEFELPSTLATVTSLGGLDYELLIPLDLVTVVSASGIDVTLSISGQIRALTTVPEPGTLLLLGAGVAGLATLGRRRAG